MAEIYYAPKLASCEDGRMRMVRVKCYVYNGSFAADTFFTVPAYVTFKRKYVKGYVTCEDGELLFRALNSHQPPEWPKRT